MRHTFFSTCRFSGTKPQFSESSKNLECVTNTLPRSTIIWVDSIWPDTLYVLRYDFAAGMPKWKKGETEFSVSLGFDKKKGYWVTVPKPIVQLLGEPDKITFEIKGKKIEVSATSQNDERE